MHKPRHLWPDYAAMLVGHGKKGWMYYRPGRKCRVMFRKVKTLK